MPCCTTQPTGRSTRLTCCASSRACTFRRSLPSLCGWGRSCWTCTWALKPSNPTRWNGEIRKGPGQGVAILRADKERDVITLDEQTTLAGVPWQAWVYQLGSRSPVEWILDQYKERKPRDPTIRERFNTYRFADHKERVIDLLQRVCTVSVKTMEIVDLKIDVLTDIDPGRGVGVEAGDFGGDTTGCAGSEGGRPPYDSR